MLELKRIHFPHKHGTNMVPTIFIDNCYTFSFSGMELAELDVNIFHKVQNLETLNLSKNNLKSIPSDLGLSKLKKMDVSENKLDSLEFVSQFEELEELWIDGNGLDVGVFNCTFYINMKV